MTWRIEWQPPALNAAAGYLKDDPEGVDALLRAADRLAGDPRPPESRPWGTDHRRLRHGPWRLLYRVDPDDQVVFIEHVGRTAA